MKKKRHYAFIIVCILLLIISLLLCLFYGRISLIREYLDMRSNKKYVAALKYVPQYHKYFGIKNIGKPIIEVANMRFSFPFGKIEKIYINNKPETKIFINNKSGIRFSITQPQIVDYDNFKDLSVYSSNLWDDDTLFFHGLPDYDLWGGAHNLFALPQYVWDRIDSDTDLHNHWFFYITNTFDFMRIACNTQPKSLLKVALYSKLELLKYLSFLKTKIQTLTYLASDITFIETTHKKIIVTIMNSPNDYILIMIADKSLPIKVYLQIYDTKKMPEGKQLALFAESLQFDEANINKYKNKKDIEEIYHKQILCDLVQYDLFVPTIQDVFFAIHDNLPLAIIIKLINKKRDLLDEKADFEVDDDIYKNKTLLDIAIMSKRKDVIDYLASYREKSKQSP